MTEYLIDRNGREWPVCKTTAVLFGLPRRTEAMIDAAVEEHGFAVVRQQASGLWVRCAPSLLSDDCHRRVSTLLRSSKQRARVLDIPAEAGAPSYRKVFTSRKSADYVLSAMVAGRRGGAAVSFRSSKQPLRPIDVERIAKSFVAGGEVATLDELAAVLDDEIFVNEPWLLWRREAGQLESRCAAISGLYTPFHAEWYANAIGRKPSDFADTYYGEMTSLGHQQVLDSGSAQKERIEAHTVLPDTGPTGLTFVRLLIPIIRPDGERLVLSTPQLESVSQKERKVARS